jgi:hypothetical protein
VVRRGAVSLDAELNLAVNLNAAALRVKGEHKMDKEMEFKPLSRDELDQLAGEELPERAAMSLINANIAIPINAAVAANVLSDNASSVADAAQSGQIGQMS